MGGSGGFHNGLKYVYLNGYDYFWIMDDDGVSEKNCLEKLINVAQKGFYYVAPMLYTYEGIAHFPETLIVKEDIVDHCGGPFNAILLSRLLISKIGLPNKYYFIWGDEFEYINRIHESYLHTALVINAIHYHKKTEDKKGLEKRIFFKVRNLIWSARLSKGIVRGKLNNYFSISFYILKMFIHYLIRLKFVPLWNLLKGVFRGMTFSLRKLREGGML